VKPVRERTTRTVRRKPAAEVRAWIYDRTIAGLTRGWYRRVLQHLPAGARMLDVGIGTGGAIARNAELIRSKDICILGIDIDADYLYRCTKVLSAARLTGHVTPRLESVYEHNGGPYDAVYFSASFMVLPDPVGALKHIKSLLAPEGRVFFTQTFHHTRTPVMEKIKPVLYKVTTMHFGRVTYERDFRQVLREGGLYLEQLATMGRTLNASYRLAVAHPRRAKDRSASEPFTRATVAPVNLQHRGLSQS